MKKNAMGIDCTGDAMTTQKSVILNYMLQGHTVSQMEAIDKFGFTRLSAIIFKIKDQLAEEGGRLAVKDRRVNGKNRYGNYCNWKEYWIETVA